MDNRLEKALHTTLSHWRAMSGADGDDAEEAADRFQASFYALIDTVRDWANRLPKRPDTVEELLAMPDMEALTERLPGPLVLNFETEAEFIVDQIDRVEDARYD